MSLNVLSGYTSCYFFWCSPHCITKIYISKSPRSPLQGPQTFCCILRWCCPGELQSQQDLRMELWVNWIRVYQPPMPLWFYVIWCDFLGGLPLTNQDVSSRFFHLSLGMLLFHEVAVHCSNVVTTMNKPIQCKIETKRKMITKWMACTMKLATNEEPAHDIKRIIEAPHAIKSRQTETFWTLLLQECPRFKRNLELWFFLHSHKLEKSV